MRLKNPDPNRARRWIRRGFSCPAACLVLACSGSQGGGSGGGGSGAMGLGASGPGGFGAGGTNPGGAGGSGAGSGGTTSNAGGGAPATSGGASNGGANGGSPSTDSGTPNGGFPATSGGAPNGGASSGGASATSGGAANGGASSIPTTPACPAPTGADVTLDQSGSSFVLSNGLVTVTVSGSGQVTQVSKNGKNLMASGDTLYVSESGGSSYYSINASAHSVVTQTSDLVELSFVDTSGAPHDMDWDIHYVMRRGVSGFYYFLITKVGTSTHPNAATLSELRTVQRFDPSVLSNGYNGERHGALPTAAQNATFTDSAEIEDATYPLTVAPTPLPGVSSVPGVTGQHYDEGPVFSKYDWATYRTEDLVHGLYGNGFGAWLISPSWEFYTGGPVKQELMVHHDNLILNMYHGGHFGSAILDASPSGWQKLYGPNLVYVNAGADDAVIADALAEGETERGEWPYCWMGNTLFPLSADRGTVTGTVAEAHGQSADGAMVVLAAAGPLITQGYDYMFWSEADASGNFTIPAVRPGTYAVHVYATQGTIVDDPDNGEIVKTVTIGAGDNDLGMLAWSPPYHAHLLFAIGTSDQRSGEFRFDPNTASGIDNTASRTGRMYGPDATHGVWTVPPANATYDVSSSTPETDWYFAQSVDGTWTVDFSLPSVPSGGAYLTLGLAGEARDPHLNVYVNGHQVVNQGFGNDQSLYRSALEGGAFAMVSTAVPATDLVTGANTVTFEMNTKGTAGAGVFYDIVKLESD